MKKRLIISCTLLILLTTITNNQKINISKFNLKEIHIENNFLLKERDLKKLLLPIYNKNLIFLDNNDIQKTLMQNNLIESFNIKKKYPNTLKIKIFEKKPIAILFNKKEKFYLSEKIDLFKFKEFPNYKNLPYVLGNENDFKEIYNTLIKINFPLKNIKRYIFYDAKRWDLETKNNKVIKLPTNNYIKSLENYLELKDKNEFKKYNIYDYRINGQLILK